MSRRRRVAVKENHDRWLVSYADFVTLLFAFFVVLFASGQTDRGRARQMSESLKEAIAGEGTGVKAALTAMLGRRPPANAATLAQPPAKAASNDLHTLLDRLAADLQHEIATGQMQVSLEPRGLLISLRQATFFPSGEDSVAPDTYASLGKLAAAIKPLPNAIRLEGHTDAMPISNSRFRSNWELSAARSIAVLNVLAGEFQVPLSRMAVVGYAETVPVAGNDTQEGRSRNRRVDVVLLNEKAKQAEPSGRGN